MSTPIIDMVFLVEVLISAIQAFAVICFMAEHAVIQHLQSILSSGINHRIIIGVLRQNNVILASQLNETVSGLEPIRISSTLTQTPRDSQSVGEMLYLLRCRLYWMQLAILRGADLSILIELLRDELNEMHHKKEL
ncbi:uncharacterized protein LOC117324830 [Pecten maximus]|uniref:uncharacterized protein LOC117324830 n=1 Tax=Pecten maximus TaxID=6579 RepID=UPI001458CAAF|nr:uncharacterized protein LOC117324830 [Pecten maximus]